MLVLIYLHAPPMKVGDFILLCKASRISGCALYTFQKHYVLQWESASLKCPHGCCDSHQNASTGMRKVTSYIWTRSQPNAPSAANTDDAVSLPPCMHIMLNFNSIGKWCYIGHIATRKQGVDF